MISVWAGETEKTHIFLGLLDSGCDLGFGRESLVFGRVDLVLPEHGEGGLDTQLLDPDLAGRHGERRGRREGGGGRAAGGKTAKKSDQVIKGNMRDRVVQKSR